MLSDWDVIYKEIFPWKPGGGARHWSDLSPDEEDSQGELELKWRQQPARLLRKMCSTKGHSVFVEDTSEDNDAVMHLTEKFDVRTMFSLPSWVQTHMFFYVVLLNTLHELIEHDLQIGDLFGAEITEDDRDEFASLRSDMETLMAVLVQSGGIELVRHKPFPIGGPGAHPQDIEDLYLTYVEHHEQFVTTRCTEKAGEAWERLNTVIQMYMRALRARRPSEFLALTSASIETRWLSNYCSTSGRPNRQLLREVNGRMEIPRRFRNDDGLLKGYMDKVLQSFKAMNDDLLTQDLSALSKIAWPLIEVAIEDAGVQTPRSFEPPADYKPVEDDGFAEQVIRHGGCPRKSLSGCTQGALTGSGWVSLPSILQRSFKIWFWNDDGEWLWHEDGDGREQPEPDQDRMTRLVAEIGPIEVLDEDKEMGPSESGAGDSSVSGVSVPESGVSCSESDASELTEIINRRSQRSHR